MQSETTLTALWRSTAGYQGLTGLDRHRANVLKRRAAEEEHEAQSEPLPALASQPPERLLPGRPGRVAERGRQRKEKHLKHGVIEGLSMTKGRGGGGGARGKFSWSGLMASLKNIVITSAD